MFRHDWESSKSAINQESGDGTSEKQEGADMSPPSADAKKTVSNSDGRATTDLARKKHELTKKAIEEART